MGVITKTTASRFGFLSHPNVLEQLLEDVAAAGLDPALFRHPQLSRTSITPSTDGLPCSRSNNNYTNLCKDITDLDAAQCTHELSVINPCATTTPIRPGECQLTAQKQTRKFKCPRCTSTFSRKDNLKTHQRIHSGETPFECRFCKRKFMWQSSARTHELTHQRRSARARRTSAPLPRQSLTPLHGKPASEQSSPVQFCLSDPLGGLSADKHASTIVQARNPQALENCPQINPSTQLPHFSVPAVASANVASIHPPLSTPVNIQQHMSSCERPAQSALSYGASQSSTTVCGELCSSEEPKASITTPHMTFAMNSQPHHAPYLLHTNRATGQQTALPQLLLPYRISGDPSIGVASAPMMLFEDIIDGDDTGRVVGALAPITPQGIAESPMFGTNRISQHDLERCMDDVLE